MKAITVATWNVHGGESVGGVSIDYAGTVASYAPDVIALQEFPDEGGARLALAIGARLGLPHSAYWGIGADDDETGLAVLSRWRITEAVKRHARHPPTSLTEGHALYDVFEKGSLTALVDHPDGCFSFSSVHLLPFHIFGLDEDHPAARRIWHQLSESILERTNLPVIIAGDFNGPVSLRLSPSALTRGGITSAVNDAPTRASGQSHDDVLVGSPFRIDRTRVVPTASDHHLCVVRLSRSADGS